jgi:hypothetical protein
MRIFWEMAGDRREFFRAAARYTLLAGLTAAGYLSARTGRLKGQRCINQGICHDCLQFANCGLPAALSRKQEERETKA